jgi:purine-nucleoside phosphorylase
MSLLSTEEQLEQFVITEKYLRSILQDYPSLETPKVLIICGSGLGGISKLLKNDEQNPQVSIKYHDIPGFEPSHVPGHSGKLIFGHLGENSTSVMCMVGRFHYYEGHNFFTNTLPIRIAKLLGVKFLVVTNAAGGVNDSYKPGDLMVINDHINLPGLAGANPLRGANLDSFGPRFLPLSDAYDFHLRYELFKCAQKLGISRPIHEGTYFYACGPTFESRAECRMLKILGADAVGMSTVPEVIIARHSGMKVIGLSLITNSVLDTKAESAKDALLNNKSSIDIVDQVKGMASHDEVLENANNAAEDVKRLVELFVSSL